MPKKNAQVDNVKPSLVTNGGNASNGSPANTEQSGGAEAMASAFVAPVAEAVTASAGSSEVAAVSPSAPAPVVVPLVPPASPVPPAPSLDDAPTGSTTKSKTLVLPLDDNDQIVWSEIKREATRDRVRRAMGTAAAGEKKAAEIQGLEKVAPAIWIGFSTLSSYLLTRRVPDAYKERLAATVAYTEEELSMLAPPTAAVLQKYAPASLGQWEAEITLLMVASQIHIQKMAAIQVELGKIQSEVRGDSNQSRSA